MVLRDLSENTQVTADRNISAEFAAVHVVERSSTLVLHFHKPPDINLPYRIENSLHQAFITYYQKVVSLTLPFLEHLQSEFTKIRFKTVLCYLSYII